jgi:hypothetical protein
MSKIQINDLDDLTVEQFATLTDLEAAGIQGGITSTQLTAGLALGAAGLGLAARVAPAFGLPGLGVAAVLTVGSIGLGALAGAAGIGGALSRRQVVAE